MQNATYNLTSTEDYENVYVLVDGILNISDQLYCNYFYLSGLGSETNVSVGGAIDIRQTEGGHIYDKYKNEITGVVWNRIVELLSCKLVQDFIATGNKEWLQNLGLKNEMFNFYAVSIENLSSIRTSLLGLIGEYGYIASNLISLTPVLFNKLTLTDRGTRPTELNFVLECLEDK